MLPNGDVSLDELKLRFQRAREQRQMSPFLECALAIGAIYENDHSLAHEILLSEGRKEPRRRETQGVRILLELQTDDLESLAASLREFVDDLPPGRAHTMVQGSIHSEEHRLLLCVRQWLPDPTTSDAARKCHQEAARGIAAARRLLSVEPDSDESIRHTERLVLEFNRSTWLPLLLDDLLVWCWRFWRNRIVAFPESEGGLKGDRPLDLEPATLDGLRAK